MRRPTIADVLEAVEYVTGVDPLTYGRMPRTMRSRRLAINALRDILECSWPETARALGYADHSTPLEQYKRHPVDLEALKAVLDRVSVLVGA